MENLKIDVQSGSASHPPRLCHLYIREDFEGYGFNLYKRKGVEGQYVSNIEAGSPAENAGLKNEDRVLEVNGSDVGGKSHKKIVAKIRDKKIEVSLLVVDKLCDEFLRRNKIKISSKHPDVVVLHSNNISDNHELLDNDMDKENTDLHEIEEDKIPIVREKTEEDVINELLADEAKDFNESYLREDLDANDGCEQVLADEEDLNISGSSDSDQENLGLTQSASTSSIHSLSDKLSDGFLTPDSGAAATDSSGDNDDIDNNDDMKNERELELPKTVKEMRIMIQQNKRRDPRTHNNLDLWQKHSIVQAL